MALANEISEMAPYLIGYCLAAAIAAPLVGAALSVLLAFRR